MIPTASGFDLTKPFKEFNNGTCLHLVSNFGNVTILYMILCRITSNDFVNVLDKERRTAVMCAVMGRKNDILKVLVQFGADVTLKVSLFVKFPSSVLLKRNL